MATDPAFAATPIVGTALLGNAETSTTSPTTTSTVRTAGTNGTKIEEIVVQATATTVAGLVYIFLHDGSNYRLFDTFAVTVTTGSATAAPFRLSRTYLNLVMPSGYSLRISQSVSGNANILVAAALGGDL